MAIEGIPSIRAIPAAFSPYHVALVTYTQRDALAFVRDSQPASRAVDQPPGSSSVTPVSADGGRVWPRVMASKVGYKVCSKRLTTLEHVLLYSSPHLKTSTIQSTCSLSNSLL